MSVAAKASRALQEVTTLPPPPELRHILVVVGNERAVPDKVAHYVGSKNIGHIGLAKYETNHFLDLSDGARVGESGSIVGKCRRPPRMDKL